MTFTSDIIWKLFTDDAQWAVIFLIFFITVQIILDWEKL